MKNLLFIAFIALAFVSCKDDDTDPIAPLVLSMGPNYANDIYYSMKDGIVSTPSRTDWDIAFYTDSRTSTIMTNDGNGVVLYVWPNGKKDNWATVDTLGIASWTALYNTYTDTTWQNGAFDKGAKGHPDYGWGVYSSLSHSVMGDSIHIITFADGSAKKLFIDRRDASNNTFYIKFANLDGSDETNAEIPCKNYLDRNFIHYSITNKHVVAHEPAKASWDLMFTKYIAQIGMPYPVVGVLSNNNILVSKMATDTSNNDYATATYSNVLNTIGYNWKVSDHTTGIFSIKEDLLYFIKDRNNKYYKLVFTEFEGSSTGNLDFVKTKY